MLNLSDEQIQDLMFVRQVDYAKHFVLGSQRAAVAASIHQDSPTPIVNFNKLSASAIQLQQQALDEHDVVHRVSWAVHCGVCSASSSCVSNVDQLFQSPVPLYTNGCHVTHIGAYCQPADWFHFL